jgi:hypothetical protein
MNQLFIPEIGTKLVLAKDWKFTLYAEGRNKKLLEYFGAYLSNYSTAIFEKDFPSFKLVYDVDFPCNKKDYYTTNISGNKKFLNDKYCQDRDFYLNTNPVNINYNTKIKIWNDDIKKASHHKSIPVILKKGIVLKVDRIYIKKGASDYSSISFFAEIDKKNYRFWAKLEDCNKIVSK